MDDLYPELPQVEVGEWMRYECSGDEFHYVKVSRLTPKLIWIDDGWDSGESVAFSREHGAMKVGIGLYDAYEGRLRKLRDGDKSHIEEMLKNEAVEAA